MVESEVMDNEELHEEFTTPSVKLSRTKSWKEYDVKNEIPYILSEGLLPVKFQATDADLDYEGALRFYFEDGNSELIKAVRLTNRTSTEELIPQLIEKFSLPEDKEYSLYEIIEKEETLQVNLLNPDECPLARAISTKKVPRFVLRRKDENRDAIELDVSKEKKRRKLFSFSRKDSSTDGENIKKNSKKNKKPRAISIEVIPLEDNNEDLVDSPFQENIEGEESNQHTADYAETDEDIEKENDYVTIDTKHKSVITLESDIEENLDETTVGSISASSIPAETEESFESLHTTSEENIDNFESKDVPQGLSTIERKRTLSFSNSSLFFDQDNEPPKLKSKDRKKKDKEEKAKKRKGSERLKSFSRMVKGNRKKDGNADPSSATELSTSKLAPGILKVFGDHVSEGSNYKAVRASTISTSQEVVKMALERYGLENCNPKDFVLCDVVGQFSGGENSQKKKGSKKSDKSAEIDEAEPEEPKWTTEYVRAINDNEKPLVLQSLWKPTNGRSRRFELRKRHEVESSCFYINTSESMGRSTSETSLFNNDSEHSSIGNDSHSGEKSEFSPLQMSPHSRSDKITTHRQDNEIVNTPPQFSPYLLLINGFNASKDQLVHKLEDPTIVVGQYMENEMKQCNIVLHSPDILLPHCWIYKKVKLDEDSSETNLDEIKFLVFVEPANGADITVNGNPISGTTLLKPGHLISFGKHYVFIFKDPTQSELTASRLSWWGYLSENLSSITSSVKSPDDPSVREKKAVGIQVDLVSRSETNNYSDDSDDDENDEVKTTKRTSNLAVRKKVEKSALQLSYNIKKEEELLHSIIDIADQELGEFKLIPAYLLMMALEHSAATFTEIQTRKLLLKMCNGLQGIAWEKTKEIGKQSSMKTVEPSMLLERVLQDLRPVFLWMASSLEMLHFLQNHLNSYLLPKEKVTTSKEALLTADDELLTVLEEVIMFTFQQTVYHLTKVLYIALPAIIDSNPFQDSEESEREGETKAVHPSVSNIPKIFQRILNTANEYQVHPQIISQLFAYLFFFANASLFNALMERGPGGKFYRWTKGVQMRGNLDVLEDWANANSLSSQFEQYLAKFRSAVDLLSTPKVQLLQFEWSQMRTDNPALNPAQLQQLLSEYQLSGKPRPRGWYPPPEEVEPALRQGDVLESFATHPPLMLPSTNFMMDLDKAPNSEEFRNYIDTIKERFDSEARTSVASMVKLINRKEPLTEQSSNDSKERKSQNKRTQSNIDENDIRHALQMNDGNNNKQNDVTSTKTVTVTSSVKSTSAESPTASDTPQAQVGSIKSIQVQSKKVTTTPNNNASNGSVNGYGGKHPQNDEVENLINNAPNLISNGDNDAALQDYDGNKDDVYVVSLDRGDRGLGLGLIDGMFTSLNTNGIYIRTVLPNTPASEDARLRTGDRILAVNGNTLVGADYNKAMDVIMKAGNRLSFLIAKSDDDVMQLISTST